MTRINTNVSSLIARNTLARNNTQLQEALTRLSTGIRINVGKDDPSGLIASENLRRDIISTNKAISNTERANQLIGTADGALGQISNLLNDIRGLVIEAANSGVLSDEQIAANQLQVDSSLEAIDRISQVTTFQGRKILDGSLDFQVNYLLGGSSVADLKIDQANFGTLDSIAVSISVTSAAQQALITNDSIDFVAGSASTGAITLGDVATAATQATGNLALANSPGTINVSAVAGTAADGAVGNQTDFTFANAADIAQASGAVTLTDSGGTIAITAVADQAADGDFGNGTNVVFQNAADIVRATGTLTLVNSNNSDIVITAVADGAADGAKGNNTIITLQAGAATGATYTAGTDTILVTVAAGATVGDIEIAINGLADFNATSADDAEVFNVLDNTTYNGELATGANGTTSAAYVVGTNTITVNRAVTATVQELANQINGLAEFNASATSGGGNTYIFSDNATLTDPLTGGDNGTNSASYDSATNVVTISRAVTATVNQLAAAINGLAEFNASATAGGTNTYLPADNGNQANPLAGGTDATTNDDVITITSETNGAAYNGTLTFARSSTVTAGQVDVQRSGSNITVAVNDNSTYDTTTLASLIQAQLSGYTVTQTGTAGNNSFNSLIDSATTTNLAGGVDDGGIGLLGDLVLKVGGADGAEVLNFGTGATLTSVISAINLVSDATGIVATNNAGVLEIRSSAYGSSAFVDVAVLNESAGGTFETNLSSTRDTGADIVATVNGTLASGDGNKLSLNTATLDLSLTVADGSSTNITFTINGGGALFQIGPDVVSNQQARIGIASVNTGELGGDDGQLYQLRSGNDSDLANNPNGATLIVDAAIFKVTGLRGRLGAFQRTTLETNIASLSDTVANLTEAESSIRDADFAAESARLTRAQILVQSSTSVLAIANQNPQNVLALLR